MGKRLALLALTATAAVGAAPTPAQAFCGFYVAPEDKPLYNDATQVALMRDGTRTVLSMSNNYRGPASDFAMVVPVPVVLQKENVKTLPLDVFSRLDKLTAPRLVEYWEQDPCPKYYPPPPSAVMGGAAMPRKAAAMADAKPADYGVKIEAKFAVGEYDILILSATQSDGLERWLIDNKYNIPKGASAALAPYIKEQQKFFVAKVNIKKIQTDENGTAVLSPLRFNYESADFRLPVRLGLINAKGKQDLIVWTLSQSTRYEVANYSNVFIPTNLEVTDGTRKSFAPFYANLFDTAVDKGGGKAVVTEYAWAASSCDPCPVPPLTPSDVAVLGGDVLFGMGAPPPPPTPPGPVPGPIGGPKGGATPAGGAARPMPPSMPRRPIPGGGYYGQMVITRLHARYDSTSLTEDLVFRSAPPVVGGRETMYGPGTTNEVGATPAIVNTFQARYIIRHPWAGPITCSNPVRGVWGGPPAGVSYQPHAATGLAATPRGAVKYASFVKGAMPAFVVTPPAGIPAVASSASASASASAEPDAGPPDALVTDASADDAGGGGDASAGGGVPPVETGPKHGCGCEVPGGSVGSSVGILAAALALGASSLRRRGRRG